jgi:WD40 repeat protein
MVIAAHDDGVYALAWSPAGDSIASGSRDCSAKVWTAADGRLLVALVGHEGEVDVVDWSADGARLATASGDTTVRLWDVADGVCLAIARCLSQVIPSLVYGEDGSELHVADDGGATANHPVRYTFEISTGS